ncbi:MAG: beta-lactamase family protein [Desulfobacteraceae bacterium]|nr:beta-lactamase family protein [Desulfobacteraceae bacterium]
MTPTKFSQFLAILTITLLVSGCVSPTSVPPTTAPIMPATTITPATAPTPTQTAEAQLASQIDAFLTALIEQDRFSGSILVAKDGKVVISEGYGMANLEHEVPNTPQTKFRLGSITKQFTAMAILQLQQQDKLDVQDPICKYIRDCPEAWQPITIHHLLTHTSGIHEYTQVSGYSDFIKQPTSPIKIIDHFRDLPLDFTPGEKWSYSNSGYTVLGYIIKKVSGEPYAIFLQHNIFQPLQMTNTGYDINRLVIKNRAQGYSSSVANADYIDMSWAYAAGGLFSTVEDLFLWDQALYTDKLIPQSLRDEMFTPFASIPGGDESYGYGWIIGKHFNHQWIMHGGRIEGFRTVIARCPDEKVTIIVLSNREDRGTAHITSEISQMIFGEK